MKTTLPSGRVGESDVSFVNRGVKLLSGNQRTGRTHFLEPVRVSVVVPNDNEQTKQALKARFVQSSIQGRMLNQTNELRKELACWASPFKYYKERMALRDLKDIIKDIKDTVKNI